MIKKKSPADPKKSPRTSKTLEWKAILDRKGSVLRQLELALLLIAPIGIWHGTTGRSCAITLLVIGALNRDDLQLSPKAWAQLGVYICIILGTAAFSPQPIQAAKAALIFASGFAMLIPGLAIGRNLKNGGITLTSLLPVTILAIIYSQSPTTFEGRLFFGLRGNPNGTGYSVLFVLIILGIAYQAIIQSGKQQRQMKLAIAVNAAAYTTYLAFSNHRTGWLAATIFYTTMAISMHPSSRMPRAVASLAGLITISASVALLDRKDFYTSIISQTNRLSLWASAIQETINSSPIFGSGFRSFREIIGIHSHQGYSRAFNHPHNIYVELFFSTGLVGVAATFWLIASLIKATQHASIDFKRPVISACAAGIVSLLIAFFFGKQLASFEVTGSLSCLAGVIWAQRDNIAYPAKYKPTT